VWSQFDGVYRAGFFAHATEDAPKFIDVELLGVLLTVFPRRLFGHDVDAIRWARGGAHEARNATHATVFISIESVHTAEGRLVLAAFEYITLFASLFGVLNDVDVLLVLPVAAHIAEGVPKGGAKPLENSWQKEPVRAAHRGWGDINDLFWINGHEGGMVVHQSREQPCPRLAPLLGCPVRRTRAMSRNLC
jgi:hypothetical protein